MLLCLGLAAYATLRGVIGALRAPVEQWTTLDLGRRGFEHQGVVDIVAAASGFGAAPVRVVISLAVGGGFLFYCFGDRRFRRSTRDIAAGLVIGGLVALGWLITGVLGADEFEPTPLASFTFVGPLGDLLQYLMTYTGSRINFGVASVLGIIAGAFLAAWSSGALKLEGFTDARDMLRHMAGGVMMGAGGVLALGCTIGQGITGMSTLALGSLIAWPSIVAGGWCGIKYLEEGSLRGALRAVLARG